MGYIFLRKYANEKHPLTVELTGVLKEVWGELHNACYGDTTPSDEEAVNPEAEVKNDDIIDVD